MKTGHLSFLTFCAFSSVSLATMVQAQPSSEPSNDAPPNAEKADRMRQQSATAHNPTEKNPTYRNQAKEQPTPPRPDKPHVKIEPGAKSTADHDHRKYHRAPHL